MAARSGHGDPRSTGKSNAGPTRFYAAKLVFPLAFAFAHLAFAAAAIFARAAALNLRRAFFGALPVVVALRFAHLAF